MLETHEDKSNVNKFLSDLAPLLIVMSVFCWLNAPPHTLLIVLCKQQNHMLMMHHLFSGNAPQVLLMSLMSSRNTFWKSHYIFHINKKFHKLALTWPWQRIRKSLWVFVRSLTIHTRRTGAFVLFQSEQGLISPLFTQFIYMYSWVSPSL